MILENLPLAKAKEKILEHVKSQKHLLLTAPTGTGKSSFLPHHLAGEKGKILVLQPRQLAARELAKFLAKCYGGNVGETVGYKFRFESKIGSKTRILFQTFGSCLASVISGGNTADWDFVIFDEFHERKAEMDLLLAFFLAKGQRVAVLSAELEREQLENYLGVKCLKIENPGFPVEVAHQEPKVNEPLVFQVERAVKSVLLNGVKKTILVFLPGKAEINQAKNKVAESLGKNAPELFSLFGGQNAEQEKIFENSENSRIIFSTNIAETSLTIPGVTAVIDSGFEKVAFDDETTGLKTLRLTRITMQNAIQRTGRAGRLQKGLCVRLWSKREEAGFIKAIKPEIERINPARFLLQKIFLENEIVWQSRNYNMDKASALQRNSIKLLNDIEEKRKIFAINKLEKLQLISKLQIDSNINIHGIAASNEQGFYIMEFGKKVLSAPVQSLELAAALCKQNPLTKILLAIAVVLESENKTGNILNLAEDFLDFHIRNKDKNANDRMHFEQLQKWASSSLQADDNKRGGQGKNEVEFLLSAFPNSLAFKNDGEQAYKTKDGISVFCESRDKNELQEKAILVLGIMRTENGKVQKTVASLYAPVAETFLTKTETHLELQWKANQKQFKAIRVSENGGVVSKEECSTEERKKLENQTAAAWKTLMEKEDFSSAWLTESNLTLLAKMKLAAQIFPEHDFPKFYEDDFALIMDEFCSGIFLLRDLNEERFKKIVEDYFGAHWLEFLNKNFPNSLKLPSGRIAKYIYSNEIVEISARIGDFAGTQGEHFIAQGRLKVRYDILAPNYRTVQKTWNLTDFWNNTYPDVRKELRGRYPKHHWI